MSRELGPLCHEPGAETSVAVSVISLSLFLPVCSSAAPFSVLRRMDGGGAGPGADRAGPE